MSLLNRVFPVLIAASLAVAGPLRAEDIAPVEAAVTAPAITTIAVDTARLTERVWASGRIAPVEEVTVAPQIEGQRIEALQADVGDRVEAGQVLAELSDETLILQRSQLRAQELTATASLAQAEAQLAEARSSADEAVRVRDRALTLRNDGTVSQAALDQAEAGATSALARVAATEQAVAAAQAQVELAALQIADVELRLERTRITAPVAGIITARNAQLGAIASAAGPAMFVLIRDGALELQADLAEQDVLRIIAGQEALIRPVGSTAPLAGAVRLVEPTVDLASRLGRVRIAIDDSAQVRSGLFAEAEIILSEIEGLALPVTAVLPGGDGQTHVLVVDADGIVEDVAVTTGIRDGALVQITAGLTAGDVVVARAGSFVRPGDRITPVALVAAVAE